MISPRSIEMFHVRPSVLSTSPFTDCMQSLSCGSYIKPSAWQASSDMDITCEPGSRIDLM